MSISKRKDEHLSLALSVEHYGRVSNGFECYPLDYDALMEYNLKESGEGCVLFGKVLKYPIIIASMTGGSEEGAKVNRDLMWVAAELGFGMGLGSMKAALKDERLSEFYGMDSDVRPKLLLGNVGAASLDKELSFEAIDGLVEKWGLDGMYCHLNGLQELVQPEGDVSHEGMGESLGRFVCGRGYPVIVKEVGNGIGEESALSLHSLGVENVECAGLGGSSWPLIEAERCRMAGDSGGWHLGQSLAALGVKSAESLVICRRVFKAGKGVVIASGGIDNVVDIIKALKLGADAVAIGMGFYRAWADGAREGALSYGRALIRGLDGLGWRRG